MNRLRRNLLMGAVVALGIAFAPYAGTGADEAGENPRKVRSLGHGAGGREQAARQQPYYGYG